MNNNAHPQCIIFSSQPFQHTTMRFTSRKYSLSAHSYHSDLVFQTRQIWYITTSYPDLKLTKDDIWFISQRRVWEDTFIIGRTRYWRTKKGFILGCSIWIIFLLVINTSLYHHHHQEDTPHEEDSAPEAKNTAKYCLYLKVRKVQYFEL